MKRDEVEKRWADSVMRQGVKQVDSAREEPALSANMTSFMGGKKRRRKRKTRRRKRRTRRKKRRKKTRKKNRKKRTKRRRRL